MRNSSYPIDRIHNLRNIDFLPKASRWADMKEGHLAWKEFYCRLTFQRDTEIPTQRRHRIFWVLNDCYDTKWIDRRHCSDTSSWFIFQRKIFSSKQSERNTQFPPFKGSSSPYEGCGGTRTLDTNELKNPKSKPARHRPAVNSFEQALLSAIEPTLQCPTS